MTLQWSSDNNTTHYAIFGDASESTMASVIDQTMHKAMGLLKENVKDESRFLLLEWSTETSTLSIVVTDDAKQKDSEQILKLCFNGDIKDEDEFIADLKFYSKDFLTTCGDFLNYSLIVVFCVNSRDQAQLL